MSVEQRAAYKALSNATFSKGDKVRVMRTWQAGEMGCAIGCDRHKASTVGATKVVNHVDRDGDVWLAGDRCYAGFALQLVEKAPTTKSVPFGAQTAKIHRDGKTEIGCQTLSGATVRKAINDYERIMN